MGTTSPSHAEHASVAAPGTPAPASVAPASANVSATPDVPIIDLHDVHFSYPGDAEEALRGVTLRIHAGEHVCVLGGNGSGKSTLVQLMNALLQPNSGTVRVFGLDAAGPRCALRIRQRAAMVFQHPEDQMVASIVADDVAFGPENLGMPQASIAEHVDTALAAVGMTACKGADPADLSGGQKQRVAIAGALAMSPQVLLLDEPSAMLDARGRRALRDLASKLNANGITVVHVTHFMEDARCAGRVVVMDAGRIVADGAPADVFEQRERIRRLGLEEPFPLQLAERLRARGLPVRDAMDPGELADEVARVLSARPASGECDGHAADRTTRLGNAPKNEPGPTVQPEAPCAAIEFEHVSFSYALTAPARGRKRTRKHPLCRLLPAAHPRKHDDLPLALHDVSFTVPEGSLTALVGHTGSGKSTTVELTCALKMPCAGAVRIMGIDTADMERRSELRRTVGYVSQLPERQLFAETVLDDIAFGPRNLGLDEDTVRARVREALDAVGLPATEALLRRSPFALSGGQQRSVALAGVLAMRPRVIVLDEPMAGLDPAGRRQTRELLTRLKRQGVTLLLVTHDMDDVAELADQMIVLEDGRLAATGTPPDVFTAEEETEAETATESAPRRTRIAKPDGPTGRPRPDSLLPRALSALGVPSALSFAQALRSRGCRLAGNPLTLDALVEEVARHATR